MASTSSRQTPGREVTVMGMETEYGILGAEPEDVVAACLEAESEQGRCPGVRWDYSGEYPLRDARGFEVDRSAVDPSMLTDVPGAVSVEGPVPGRLRTTVVARLTAQEEAWQRGTATCLSSGGRLYVDHGHPEYATPECTGAAQATLADRAGDLLVARGAELLRRRGVAARLFKNNVDGKGATYGTHENYLVPRSIDFDDLTQALRGERLKGVEAVAWSASVTTPDLLFYHLLPRLLVVAEAAWHGEDSLPWDKLAPLVEHEMAHLRRTVPYWNPQRP